MEEHHTPRKNDELIITMLKDIKEDVSKMRLWAFGENGGNGANSKITRVCDKVDTLEESIKEHKSEHWKFATLIVAVASLFGIAIKKAL